MYEFSPEEWETCIKVLQILKKDPYQNPDNALLSGLISKIYKTAKKVNRKASQAAELSEFQKLMGDLDTAKQPKAHLSTITQNALENTSLYDAGTPQPHTYTRVEKPTMCYVCKDNFREIHNFYNQLCPACAEFNYEKRFQQVNLEGKIVVLTGGRVKIGYATALKLLRNGATLILTTRFPALALADLEKEPDFETWKNRLTIYGLDLRFLGEVSNFCTFLKNTFGHLDIIIHNAAQTIKYPDEYYLPLVKKETQLLENAPAYLLPNAKSVLKNTQLLEDAEAYAPVLNRFGQPTDFREKNSWNARLHEVEMLEVIEVNIINQIAPYYMLAELRPLLENSTAEQTVIINVTSSEGQFSYKGKTMFHPHTNMTKAALNMLTRTSAQDFEESDIFMNAVDVGWVSTGAVESKRKALFEIGFIPPLDSVDGAARILDVIALTFSGDKTYGKLWKNYKIVDW